MRVPVVENVLKLNDEVAAINRQSLDGANVFAVDLIGAPGCGKTSLLEATLRELADQLRMAVIVGDLATSRDGDRLQRWTPHVVQINTGRGCHLDANQVRQAMAHLDLNTLDVLIIENVGNLICPVGFDLGQHAKVGMFSVSEGDDKAAKHPHLVTAADVLLLNKTDLAPYVSFEKAQFLSDVAKLNPSVATLEISVRQAQIGSWLDWIVQQARQPLRNQSQRDSRTSAQGAAQAQPWVMVGSASRQSANQSQRDSRTSAQGAAQRNPG